MENDALLNVQLTTEFYILQKNKSVRDLNR